MNQAHWLPQVSHYQVFTINSATPRVGLPRSGVRAEKASFAGRGGKRQERTSVRGQNQIDLPAHRFGEDFGQALGVVPALAVGN